MNQSDKSGGFQKIYQEIQQQQNEEKNNFMRQNYDKLPTWSRQEVTSGVLGSHQATSGVLEGLCKNIQQKFDEDKEKFLKDNADKLPSWSKYQGNH